MSAGVRDWSAVVAACCHEERSGLCLPGQPATSTCCACRASADSDVWDALSTANARAESLSRELSAVIAALGATEDVEQGRDSVDAARAVVDFGNAANDRALRNESEIAGLRAVLSDTIAVYTAGNAHDKIASYVLSKATSILDLVAIELVQP